MVIFIDEDTIEQEELEQGDVISRELRDGEEEDEKE